MAASHPSPNLGLVKELEGAVARAFHSGSATVELPLAQAQALLRAVRSLSLSASPPSSRHQHVSPSKDRSTWKASRPDGAELRDTLSMLKPSAAVLSASAVAPLSLAASLGWADCTELFSTIAAEPLSMYRPAGERHTQVTFGAMLSAPAAKVLSALRLRLDWHATAPVVAAILPTGEAALWEIPLEASVSGGGTPRRKDGKDHMWAGESVEPLMYMPLFEPCEEPHRPPAVAVVGTSAAMAVAEHLLRKESAGTLNGLIFGARYRGGDRPVIALSVAPLVLQHDTAHVCVRLEAACSMHDTVAEEHDSLGGNDVWVVPCGRSSEEASSAWVGEGGDMTGPLTRPSVEGVLCACVSRCGQIVLWRLDVVDSRAKARLAFQKHLTDLLPTASGVVVKGVAEDLHAYAPALVIGYDAILPDGTRAPHVVRVDIKTGKVDKKPLRLPVPPGVTICSVATHPEEQYYICGLEKTSEVCVAHVADALVIHRESWTLVNAATVFPSAVPPDHPEVARSVSTISLHEAGGLSILTSQLDLGSARATRMQLWGPLAKLGSEASAQAVITDPRGMAAHERSFLPDTAIHTTLFSVAVPLPIATERDSSHANVAMVVLPPKAITPARTLGTGRGASLPQAGVSLAASAIRDMRKKNKTKPLMPAPPPASEPAVARGSLPRGKFGSLGGKGRKTKASARLGTLSKEEAEEARKLLEQTHAGMG
jgi:hypothetical protein